MDYKDYKLAIELLVAIILCVLIATADPNKKMNDFMVDILCEKPYIFLFFILIYFIAIYSPLVAILIGVYIIVLDNNINMVVKEKDC